MRFCVDLEITRIDDFWSLMFSFGFCIIMNGAMFSVKSFKFGS